MESIKISATRNTPSVTFDQQTKTFSLIGNSIPENAGEFYTPVIGWLRKELPGMQEGTIFEFCLPYFNSSSLKALYLLLVEIKKEMDSGKRLEAVWHMEEDDDFMAEAAETFAEMTEIEFTLKQGLLHPASDT